MVSFHSFPFCFILMYSFLFCSFSPDQPQKKSELQTSPSHLNCVDETENLHIQADSGQSTAEERNFPQGSLQPIVATVEQLTAEEKNHPPGDEGSNRWWYHPGKGFQASCWRGIYPGERIETEEKQNRSKLYKEQIKGHLTEKRQFYFSSLYGFLKLVRYL